MMSESITWYMLVWIFLTVFIGGLSPIGYLMWNGYCHRCDWTINAITPILNPNHSVMAEVTLAFIGIVGSIAMIYI